MRITKSDDELQIAELGKIILRLNEQVESMKNCANCRHIVWSEDDLLCAKNWVGSKMDKCDHWQKI